MCKLCGQAMHLTDEEEQRWYCYKDDLVYLAKEDSWSDQKIATASTVERKIVRREIPSGFQVWQPIIFGGCAFLVVVVVFILFTIHWYPAYQCSSLDFYYFHYDYCRNYYNLYLTVRVFSSLGLYVADGVFLNWSAKKFNTPTPLIFWIVFILLLPVAFVWHTWDLHDLRRKHNNRKKLTQKAFAVVPATKTRRPARTNRTRLLVSILILAVAVASTLYLAYPSMPHVIEMTEVSTFTSVYEYTSFPTMAVTSTTSTCSIRGEQEQCHYGTITTQSTDTQENTYNVWNIVSYSSTANQTYLVPPYSSLGTQTQFYVFVAEFVAFCAVVFLLAKHSNIRRRQSS
jgi:hypothetical protein